jgi:TetR/AcrR family transcriptional repressor of nem operon
LKKVGVPKGSFYHYFANKETFSLAVIESYAHYFSNKSDGYLLDEAYPTLIRIRNFVESAKRGMSRYDFKRGCLVGNLGQEVDLLPDSFRAQLINIFHQWEEKLTTCLNTAQIQGDLCKKANCTELAEFFWTGWEGAVSRAKLVKHTKPLDNYLNHFISSLPKQ